MLPFRWLVGRVVAWCSPAARNGKSESGAQRDEESLCVKRANAGSQSCDQYGYGRGWVQTTEEPCHLRLRTTQRRSTHPSQERGERERGGGSELGEKACLIRPPSPPPALWYKGQGSEAEPTREPGRLEEPASQRALRPASGRVGASERGEGGGGRATRHGRGEWVLGSASSLAALACDRWVCSSSRGWGFLRCRRSSIPARFRVPLQLFLLARVRVTGSTTFPVRECGLHFGAAAAR